MIVKLLKYKPNENPGHLCFSVVLCLAWINTTEFKMKHSVICRTRDQALSPDIQPYGQCTEKTQILHLSVHCWLPCYLCVGWTNSLETGDSWKLISHWRAAHYIVFSHNQIQQLRSMTIDIVIMIISITLITQPLNIRRYYNYTFACIEYLRSDHMLVCVFPIPIFLASMLDIYLIFLSFQIMVAVWIVLKSEMKLYFC
jgi:hypothetical protein